MTVDKEVNPVKVAVNLPQSPPMFTALVLTLFNRPQSGTLLNVPPMKAPMTHLRGIPWYYMSAESDHYIWYVFLATNMHVQCSSNPLELYNGLETCNLSKRRYPRDQHAVDEGRMMNDLPHPVIVPPTNDPRVFTQASMQFSSTPDALLPVTRCDVDVDEATAVAASL